MIVAMIRESPVVGAEFTVNQTSHEVAKDNEPSSNMEYSGVQVRTRTRTVHISSSILAAKSHFFYELFSNGMRELEQRHATSRIQASEEDALMDLLNFIHCNTLPRTTPTALLDVVMAADKYEVASCTRYCTQSLLTLPMTYATKQFFAGRFKHLSKHQEEVLNLPLAAIEAVLSSDDLQVTTEDAVGLLS